MTLLRITLCVLLLTAGAVLSSADAVPILNASFELPDVGDFIQGSIQDWAKVSGDGNNRFGVAELGSGSINPRAIDGAQVAFFREGSYVVGQTLGISVTANTAYTLSLWIGTRTELPTAGYTFGLFANGVALVSESSTTGPASGTWINRTLTYTATAADPNLGQAIEIRLGGLLTDAAGTRQTVFDAVTLDAAAVPEPSTWALLACGAVAFVAVRRSRVRS